MSYTIKHLDSILECATPEEAIRLAAAISRCHTDMLQQLIHRSRTRPDYDLRCDQCGAPHWIDTVIPSELWNQIAPDGGVLCMLCIDDRLAEKGLKADAEFYFAGKALTSKMYASAESAKEVVEDGR